MANSAQARKRARQSVKQRAHNMTLRSELRTAIKKVRKAVAAGNPEAAAKQLQESQAVIDRMASKRICHPNTAARQKSNLSKAVKALAKK
ncbi:MAG: ribosomal subunit protein [Pseudomonadota bacterium]|jgi:small subunit ribosomal protein S20